MAALDAAHSRNKVIEHNKNDTQEQHMSTSFWARCTWACTFTVVPFGWHSHVRSTLSVAIQGQRGGAQKPTFDSPLAGRSAWRPRPPRRHWGECAHKWRRTRSANYLPLISRPVTSSGTACNEQWAQLLWFKPQIYQAPSDSSNQSLD